MTPQSSYLGIVSTFFSCDCYVAHGEKWFFRKDKPKGRDSVQSIKLQMRQSNFSGTVAKVSLFSFQFGVFLYIEEALGGTKCPRSWPGQFLADSILYFIVPMNETKIPAIIQKQFYLSALSISLPLLDAVRVGTIFL
jgi:hypothetical protein